MTTVRGSLLDHERIRFAEFNRTITTIILGGDPIVVPEFPSDDIDEPKVLDCGFGTGAWISDLQDEEIYSHCVVFGIDIFDCDAKRIIDEDDEETEDDERQDSPVQEFVKIKWNLNAPFARHPELGRGTFHLINSRFLADGIDKNRWEPLVREYMEMLAPEGWLQMVEFDWVFQSDRGQNLPNLERWWNMYSGALRSMRKEKDPVVARKLHQLMANAGFDTIKEERKRVPVGDWSNDDTDGVMLHRSWTREVISNMLESFALVPFTRVLGRTQSECELFTVESHPIDKCDSPEIKHHPARQQQANVRVRHMECPAWNRFPGPPESAQVAAAMSEAEEYAGGNVALVGDGPSHVFTAKRRLKA
ncbi:hypothetical protein Q7P37_009367 [Cladosporium fusiforme]